MALCAVGRVARYYWRASGAIRRAQSARVGAGGAERVCSGSTGGGGRECRQCRGRTVVRCHYHRLQMVNIEVNEVRNDEAEA